MEKKYEREINILDNRDFERELYERCRLYFALYSQLKEKNFEEDWKKYDILLDSQKGILIEYKKCFSVKETAIDEECLGMLDLILPDNSSDERSLFSDTWDAIKNAIEKEIDFEQKVYSYLQKLAEDHPVMAKLIVVILMGILLGLAEDCIHDAIKKEPESTPVVNVYIQEEGPNLLDQQVDLFENFVVKNKGDHQYEHTNFWNEEEF